MHAECVEHGRDAVPEPPIVIVIAERRDHRLLLFTSPIRIREQYE